MIIIKSAIFWGIGYGLIWFTKWALVDIIYGRELIKTSIIQGLYRGTGEEISYFETVQKNMMILGSNFQICILFGIVGAIINLILYRKNELSVVKNAVKVFPYAVISAMPFVWYFVLRGHSWEHAFFTYRALTLALICIPLMLFKAVEKEGKDET